MIYYSAFNSFSECKSGYVSKNGEPCQRCKPGTYGKKCAFICNCKDSNRYFVIRIVKTVLLDHKPYSMNLPSGLCFHLNWIWMIFEFSLTRTSFRGFIAIKLI